MSENSTLHEARKSIHRCMVRAALVWRVDPNNLKNNPIFMDDGALHYCDHLSTFQDAHLYLSERSILETATDGAYRLNVPLSQVSKVSDFAFEQGCDFEQVLGLLMSLLIDYFSGVDFPPSNLPQYSWDMPKEIRAEIQDMLNQLNILGYVVPAGKNGENEEYRWTEKAAPIFKKYMFFESDDWAV